MRRMTGSQEFDYYRIRLISYLNEKKRTFYDVENEKAREAGVEPGIYVRLRHYWWRWKSRKRIGHTCMMKTKITSSLTTTMPFA